MASWRNIMQWSVLATVALCTAAPAAGPGDSAAIDAKPVPKASAPSMASGTWRPEYRPPTEVDLSGPYHAQLNGESYPAALDFWGSDAMLKITMDGQDKPMLGRFVNNQLQVLYKYGLANFNLTTAVQAQYDGWSFNGQYRRIDEKLGAKVAPITLVPNWWNGGGGVATKLPLPRKSDDIPGRYGLLLTKDGRKVYAQATMEVDGGQVKLKTSGRDYVADFSGTEIAPVYWEGNRMDTFKLNPTEFGFKGTLQKEVGSRKEEFDVLLTKGIGNGGGGHERHWTYVYDAIVDNSLPVGIAKLTLHEQEADLAIMVRGEKSVMTGSLVDGILSGTGKHRNADVSIRAKETTGGFAGVMRTGAGPMVREFPVVLKNRAVRAVPEGW